MRVLKISVAFIALICLVNFGVFAMDEGDDETKKRYDEQLYSSGADKLPDSLPNETKGLLDELGLDEIDFYSIFETSPRKIIDLFLNLIKGQMKSPLTAMAKLLGIMILMALTNSFAPSNEKTGYAINITCGAFVLMALIKPMSVAISGAVAAVSALSTFMLALIPVLAGIITASGNPLLALSFNSIAFISAQGISQAIKGIVIPSAGIVMAMGAIGSITPDFKLNELGDLVKKVVIGAFSFLVTMFSTFLSIKGVMANAADTLAAKGVKLAVSGIVPIVGSTIADSYSSIIGSVALVKSTVGVFGIACVLLICAPIVIELTMWGLGMKILSSFSKMMGLDGTDLLFNAIGSGITLLNICIIFDLVLMVITLGITLAIRTGV